MNITELDEWQGITEDMVRGWLLSHGWEITETGNGSIDAKKRFADRVTVLGCHWETCLGWLLIRVAAAHKLTVQALLREINPRMRKGMPSKAAREAHGFKGGMWVGSRGEAGSGGTLVFVSFDDSPSGLPLTVWDFSEFDTWEVGQSEIDDEWLFWPADESGNKIHWYSDSEGNML